MAATTLNGALLTGTHAGRPAGSAVAKGALYACSDHKLIYQSDSSSWGTWIDASGSGSGIAATLFDAKGDLIVATAADTAARKAVGSNFSILVADSGQSDGLLWWQPQSYRYLVTGSSYTLTGSTSWTDIDSTNLARTWTTKPVRVRLTLVGSFTINNAAGEVDFDFDVDGTRIGTAGTSGIQATNQAVISELLPVSLSILTPVLSAGSHTFKAQWRIGNSAHTATLAGGSGSGAVTYFAVEETIYAT